MKSNLYTSNAYSSNNFFAKASKTLEGHFEEVCLREPKKVFESASKAGLKQHTGAAM